jgi:Zn-dependent alcohol dehydrogenase
MSTDMKAILMTAVKEPFRTREIPDPHPGPGQVRIRLHATGVCGTDVHVWNGELPGPLPIVPGHEPVGVIDSVGQGVRSVTAGDRVGVSWFQAGCGRCQILPEETNQVLPRAKNLDDKRRRVRRLHDRRSRGLHIVARWVGVGTGGSYVLSRFFGHERVPHRQAAGRRAHRGDRDRRLGALGPPDGQGDGS